MKGEKLNRVRNALISFARKEFEMKNSAQGSNSEIMVTSDQDASTSMLEEQVYANANSRLVAPISPTPISLMNEIIPQLRLDSSSRVIELGCGDGRWMVNLAERFRCQCIGVEIDEDRLRLARKLLQEKEMDGKIHDSVSLLSRDIFEFLEDTDFVGDQDIVIMYLFREAMVRIGKVLKEKGLLSSCEEQTKGVDSCQYGMKNVIQVLCIGFKLPGFLPVWQSRVEGIRAYLYYAEKS